MENIYTSYPKQEYLLTKEAINAAIERVLDKGIYVLGDEVKAFEAEFAQYLGVKHCIGVANGTDALTLALRGLGVQNGDEVILPAHTSNFTALGVSNAGATPIFIDVHADDYTLNEELITAAITPKTKAIIAVHLYGHPANMPKIMELAKAHNLAVLEDCAQAHGAKIGDRFVGSFGDAAAFSFYPTKNLGAIGDGGAVVCQDDTIAEKITLIKNGGQASKYYHTVIGINSRLDELQAAILRVKLSKLEYFIAERNRVAQQYQEFITHPKISKPVTKDNARHAYHLYVIKHPERDALQKYLESKQIFTQVHYPIPCHLQPCYANLKKTAQPVSEAICKQILSLPIYPDLKPELVSNICTALNSF